MNAARSFTDIMRPPEIDACKAPLREVIWRLEAMGYKANVTTSWLTVVLLETVFEEDSWTDSFYRMLARINDRGVMTGRFPSGWSGAPLRQSCTEAFMRRRGEAKPEPVARNWEDAAYGNELDMRTAMMRTAVIRLQADGYKGRHISLALLEVLAESAAEESPQALRDFTDHMREWGETHMRIFHWDEAAPEPPAAVSDRTGLN